MIDPDRARIQRSAMRVGVLVAVASAVVIAGGVAILIAVLLLRARPDDHHGDDDHGALEGDRIVVDVDDVLPWVIVLGLVGVVLLGVIAWLAARWSVRPLAEALHLQRSFVSDASHELRTPLTALTSRIQILQRRRERGEPVDDTIADLRRDAAVLDDVLTDMLLTAEGGSAEVGRADVAVCVAAAIQTLAPLAAESGVAIVDRASGDAAVAVPGVTLTRLCVALIDNAIQHSPAGSEVVVTATRAARHVELRVSDAGTGIPPDDRERVFERFARAEESGRRRGFGLGLALVRETAGRFGGGVHIEQTSPTGTTFLLVLPAA